jgi:hypothetical protein
MAPRYIDFLVTGDPVTARATAEQALVARKFAVTWHDDWTATAERGSMAANLLAGALAQHFKVGVHIMSSQPGEVTVRIDRLSSGWTGGAIGASRTRKNLASLRSELEATFGAAGVLRGVNEG